MTAMEVLEPAVIFPTKPPSLRLGQICSRLDPGGYGFTMSAEFLKHLGFGPAATEKAAKLYHESDFAAMWDALIHHVKNVQFSAALKSST